MGHITWQDWESIHSETGRMVTDLPYGIGGGHTITNRHKKTAICQADRRFY